MTDSKTREAIAYDRQLEFDKEEYLVQFIKDNLMTDELWDKLAELRASIEDVLNGRLSAVNDDSNPAYGLFFDTWNKNLGRKEFGF